MAFDLVKSYFSRVLEKQVASGQTIGAEGLVLVHVLENGLGKVGVSTGAATEIVVGMSITDSLDDAHGTLATVESAVVPSSAPYTYQILHPMYVANSVRVQDVTAGSDIPASGGGSFTINGTGLITVPAGAAGHTINVYYRWNPTLAEIRQTFYQRNVNRAASEFFGQLSVGMGEGEVYVDNYDTTADFSVANDATHGLVVLAGGILSFSTLSGKQAFPGHVIALPTVDSPKLGVAFNIKQV